MTMRIGEAAIETGVRPDTLRYYERQGLLAAAPKDAAGRRAYAHDIVRRVRFIKQAQQAGFRLSEIRDLLSLRIGGGACCGEVRSRAAAKRQELAQKLTALKTILDAMDAVLEACNKPGLPVAECPILQALDQGLIDAEALKTSRQG